MYTQERHAAEVVQVGELGSSQGPGTMQRWMKLDVVGFVQFDAEKR